MSALKLLIYQNTWAFAGYILQFAEYCRISSPKFGFSYRTSCAFLSLQFLYQMCLFLHPQIFWLPYSPARSLSSPPPSEVWNDLPCCFFSFTQAELLIFFFLSLWALLWQSCSHATVLTFPCLTRSCCNSQPGSNTIWLTLVDCSFNS